MRGKYHLDTLNTRELRVEIERRNGSSKGIYERNDLVNHLAGLIVFEEESKQSSEHQAERERSSRAMEIIRKRRELKSLSIHEIKRRLEEAKIGNVNSFRSREDLETALALLLLKDADMPSSPSSSAEKEVLPVMETVGILRDNILQSLHNLSDSLSTPVAMNVLKNLTSELTMTSAERSASRIVRTHDSMDEGSNGVTIITEEMMKVAREELANVTTFEEAVDICSSFSKPLLRALLVRDYNLSLDKPFSKTQLVNLLSDATIVRKKIITNYSADIPFASSDAEVSSFSSGNNRTKARLRRGPRWSESILIPEKELIIWSSALFKRTAAATRKILTNKLDWMDGVANMATVLLGLGLEVTNKIMLWAVGNKAHIPSVLFVFTLFTMLLRKGVLFFAGLVMGARLARIAFSKNAFSASNSNS